MVSYFQTKMERHAVTRIGLIIIVSYGNKLPDSTAVIAALDDRFMHLLQLVYNSNPSIVKP